MLFRSHCAENADRHFEAVGHEDRDALTLHSDALQAPRKSGNRPNVLGECQAAILADQSPTIGRPCSNTLQRVKDRGIIWSVGGNRQFHAEILWHT